MANAADIIKEYLVSIGFTVDKKSQDAAKKGMSEIEKAMGGIGKAFAEVGKTALDVGIGLGTTTAGVIALSASISAMGDKLGNITMGVDKFAISLFTSRQNAYSLKRVMDVMGVKSVEDLKYINLIPEQRQQFMALRGLAASLQPNTKTLEGLNDLRKIGFQFQKSTLEIQYIAVEILGLIGRILNMPFFQRALSFMELIIAFVAYIVKTVEDFFGKHPKSTLFGGAAGGIAGGVAGTMAGRWAGGAVGGILGAPLGPVGEAIGIPLGALAGGAIGGSIGTTLGGAGGAIGGGALADHKKQLEDKLTGVGDWMKGFTFTHKAEGGYKKAEVGDYETGAGGISKPVYDDYRKSHPNAPDIRHVTRQIAADIFKNQYWDKFNSWKLSTPLHIAAADSAFMSGVGTTAGLLKKSHGDVNEFFKVRRQFLSRVAELHPEKRKYLKGWMSREDNLEKTIRQDYPQNINVAINVNGVKSPMEVAELTAHKVKTILNTRNMQGSYG